MSEEVLRFILDSEEYVCPECLMVKNEHHMFLSFTEFFNFFHLNVFIMLYLTER